MADAEHAAMSPLPTPRGRQTDVVHLSSDRHHVVLGTAGTGKSTMAMLRGLHLARAATANHGPVLVVTYNNTLVTYLRFLGPEVAGRLTIETYGRFARGYLNSVGLMRYGCIAKPRPVDSLVARAIVEVRASGNTNAVLSRDLGWMVDEIHWISGMGLAAEADYQAIDRIGRQTPLGVGAPRTTVWAVREKYKALRAALGLMYDWYDIASSVCAALAIDPRPRKYKHIIIDEGQDLSPEMIRSLTAAVAPGGSLTFFGDYHQAIYGQGLSWRRSGIHLDGRRVERFVDNYRNTAQVAKVAIAMSSSPYMSGADEDLVAPKAPVAAGPLPTLLHAKDPAGEVAFLKAFVQQASVDQSVGVLARTRAEAESVVRGLNFTRLDNEMSSWDDSPGIYVGAYHSAKGLEFDAVVLPFLNDDTFPHPEVLHSFTEEEACSREARLLYVSVTRARVTLVMSYSGTLTRLLPDNSNLWTEEEA